MMRWTAMQAARRSALDRVASNDWFDVGVLAPGVWRIAEPGHVCSWLVEGTEGAALIDTGCGIAPIRPVVEALTDREVLVVSSHHHFDHVGGNHEFDEIAIHPAGAAALAQDVDPQLLHLYSRYAEGLARSFERFEELDRRYFHLLAGSDQRARPLPQGFRWSDWSIPGSVATRLLDDGDVVDLGGRELVVWHTPGHSPDSICLELRPQRLLFGCDTVNTGPVYAQLPGSSLTDFAHSLARLARISERFERVFCSHFLRTEVMPGYLEDQARAFSAVAAGEIPLEPAADCLDEPCREARFNGYSILVPS
jgi:glyoxylase-like metal-dependent hydrolase (beta-lactamase superfamily II)